MIRDWLSHNKVTVETGESVYFDRTSIASPKRVISRPASTGDRVNNFSMDAREAKEGVFRLSFSKRLLTVDKVSKFELGCF